METPYQPWHDEISWFDEGGCDDGGGGGEEVEEEEGGSLGGV